MQKINLPPEVIAEIKTIAELCTQLDSDDLRAMITEMLTEMTKAGVELKQRAESAEAAAMSALLIIEAIRD